MTPGKDAQENLQTEWLTYEQAQLLSSIGRTKLWELCSAKHIKAAKVGKAVRISRRSLTEYMERQTTE